MNRSENADYVKITTLLCSLILLLLSGFLLFSDFSFLLLSPYESFKVWYPHYHILIYTILQGLKILSIVVPCITVFKFRENVYELFRVIRQQHYRLKIILINGNAIKPSVVYKKQFLLIEVVLLFAALFSYYCIAYKREDYFQIQLLISRIYVLNAIAIVIVWCYINLNYFSVKIRSFLFAPSSPYNLAVYRILFFFYLGVEYIIHALYRIQFIESKPREALPFIGWLIEIIPITKELYFCMCIGGLVCCFFLITGLFTRFFLVVNAFVVFYCIAAPNFYGKLWHIQFPIWVSWFLLFAPVSKVFSLDRLLFIKNEPLYASPDFTFPIKIIWLQLGMIYFWAGIYKLWDTGFEWALGQNMLNQVRLEWFENFDKVPFLRIDKLPVLLHLGGLAVIFFELLFIVFLFSRKLKYISIAGGLIMHNLIGLSMYIFFGALQLHYIVFVNYEKILIRLNKWFPSFAFSNKIVLVKITINKKLVVVSCIVFGFNFIFGMNKINSYPFSPYPTYSEHVESIKEYFHYQIIDRELSETDIWELGKQNDFRWERFSRLEYSIIQKYNNTGIADTIAINNQWTWWTNQLTILKSADSVDVFIYKRSLNPDSANIIIDKKYLVRLYPNTLLKNE